jgi:DNA/RNA-binding domain of Phe-tRNA-synthetase-like protein
MFYANLVRQGQVQDNIEVMVLSPQDERFLKRNGIQVDVEDRTHEIALVARLVDGRTVEATKNAGTMRDLFAQLVKACETVLNRPTVVH